MEKKINLAFATFRKSDKCSLAQGGHGLHFNAVLSGFYLDEILPTPGNWLTVSCVLHWNFQNFLPFMCILVEVGRWPIWDYQPDLVLNLSSASLILSDRYNFFHFHCLCLEMPYWSAGIEKERSRTVNILCVCISFGPSNKCKLECYLLHFRGFI